MFENVLVVDIMRRRVPCRPIGGAWEKPSRWPRYAILHTFRVIAIESVYNVSARQCSRGTSNHSKHRWHYAPSCTMWCPTSCSQTFDKPVAKFDNGQVKRERAPCLPIRAA